VRCDSGLENLGTKLLAKKRQEEERKGETVWEAYLRKRREKRKERKHGRRLGRGERDGESSDSDEYDEVEDERPGRGNPNGKVWTSGGGVDTYPMPGCMPGCIPHHNGCTHEFFL